VKLSCLRESREFLVRVYSFFVGRFGWMVFLADVCVVFGCSTSWDRLVCWLVGWLWLVG
jgi:hypothetical protein